jgi:hypothetical protein
LLQPDGPQNPQPYGEHLMAAFGAARMAHGKNCSVEAAAHSPNLLVVNQRKNNSQKI